MNALELTDEVLVEQSRSGDLEAFRVLVTRYQNKIYNTVYRIVGDAEEADNLLQETFIKVHRALEQFESKASFSTWLYRIAVNTCASHIRKSKTQRRKRLLSLDTMGGGSDGERVQIADGTRTAQEQMIGEERQMAIQQAITELDEDLRRIVVLKDVEDHSYEEIAEILECPIGTVKSRLFKARELLRSRLKNLLT